MKGIKGSSERLLMIMCIPMCIVRMFQCWRFLGSVFIFVFVLTIITTVLYLESALDVFAGTNDERLDGSREGTADE